MLSRLICGGRISLMTGFMPVIVATMIGTAIGATAGYVRGWVGAVLMRTMDMLYAFPAIMLAIAISASLGPGVRNTIIAISIVFIPPIARVAEAATRQVIFLEYIEAARLSGASTPHIIFYQLLANIFNPIFVLRLRPGGAEHRHRLRPQLPRPWREPAEPGVGLHAQQPARRDLRPAVGRGPPRACSSSSLPSPSTS